MIASNSASSSANEVSIRHATSRQSRADLAADRRRRRRRAAARRARRRRAASAGIRASASLGGAGLADDLDVGLGVEQLRGPRAGRPRGRRAGTRGSQRRSRARSLTRGRENNRVGDLRPCPSWGRRAHDRPRVRCAECLLQAVGLARRSYLVPQVVRDQTEERHDPSAHDTTSAPLLEYADRGAARSRPAPIAIPTRNTGSVRPRGRRTASRSRGARGSP